MLVWVQSSLLTITTMSFLAKMTVSFLLRTPAACDLQVQRRGPLNPRPHSPSEVTLMMQGMQMMMQMLGQQQSRGQLQQPSCSSCVTVRCLGSSCQVLTPCLWCASA
jgi:hypothetical protein